MVYRILVGLLFLQLSVRCEDPVKCERPATEIDIMTILDESRSVKDYYKDEISFMKSFVTAFPVSTNGIRIGLVRFSDNSALEFNLAKYTSVQPILDALDALVRAGTHTDISSALKTAANTYKDPSGGARTNSLKIIMLLTDGKHTGKGDAWDVADEIRKDQDVKFVVVGVTDSVNREELQKIAGVKSNYYHADNFTVLISREFENKVATGVCDDVIGGLTTTQPPTTTTPITTITTSKPTTAAAVITITTTNAATNPTTNPQKRSTSTPELTITHTTTIKGSTTAAPCKPGLSETVIIVIVVLCILIVLAICIISIVCIKQDRARIVPCGCIAAACGTSRNQADKSTSTDDGEECTALTSTDHADQNLGHVAMNVRENKLSIYPDIRSSESE